MHICSCVDLRSLKCCTTILAIVQTHFLRFEIYAGIMKRANQYMPWQRGETVHRQRDVFWTKWSRGPLLGRCKHCCLVLAWTFSHWRYNLETDFHWQTVLFPKHEDNRSLECIFIICYIHYTNLSTSMTYVLYFMKIADAQDNCGLLHWFMSGPYTKLSM